MLAASTLFSDASPTVSQSLTEAVFAALRLCAGVLHGFGSAESLLGSPWLDR